MGVPAALVAAIADAVRPLGIEIGQCPVTSRLLWDLAERAQQGLAAQLVTVPLFHEHRILCQVAGHRMNVVKALPALVAGEDDIRGFAAALEDVVARAERLPSAYASLGLGFARRTLGSRPGRSRAATP